MNPRALAMIGLLLLLAGGSLWLLRQTALQGAQGERPKTHEPDYYFTDATVTSLGEDGQPASELKSPRIIHHPDDDSTESFDPRMRYFTKHGMPWYVQSDHAVSPSGNHWVYLDGHVQITRPSATGGPPLVIVTDKMAVNLDTNVASTDDPVQLDQGKNHTQGVGMDAYLNDNRLVLRTAVRGHYVTQQTQH